jgi:hypothetical protein
MDLMQQLKGVKGRAAASGDEEIPTVTVAAPPDGNLPCRVQIANSQDK